MAEIQRIDEATATPEKEGANLSMGEPQKAVHYEQ